MITNNLIHNISKYKAVIYYFLNIIKLNNNAQIKCITYIESNDTTYIYLTNGSIIKQHINIYGVDVHHMFYFNHNSYKNILSIYINWSYPYYYYNNINNNKQIEFNMKYLKYSNNSFYKIKKIKNIKNISIYRALEIKDKTKNIRDISYVKYQNKYCFSFIQIFLNNNYSINKKLYYNNIYNIIFKFIYYYNFIKIKKIIPIPYKNIKSVFLIYKKNKSLIYNHLINYLVY